MTIKIGLLTADDAHALAALHARCFALPWSAASFREALLAPGTVCFAAHEQQAPLGLLLARAVAPEAELLTLCVMPEQRGRGLATALLRQMRAWALETDISEVWLEVRAGAGAVIRLYEKNGFTQAARRRGYYVTPDEPPEDALVLKALYQMT